MEKNFYDLLKSRRSIYGISKESTVEDKKIQEIIDNAIMYTPSAFNSQSGRVVVLFGEHHNKLWDIAKETLRKVVPADKFAPTEGKINSFREGYGTVLFFEDNTVVEALQTKFALYKDNFPIWSLESNGILQYIVWMSLANEGLGSSLQHYNPLIDEEVKKTWNIPDGWKLLGQMPFGKPTTSPDEKTFEPIEQRVKIFK